MEIKSVGARSSIYIGFVVLLVFQVFLVMSNVSAQDVVKIEKVMATGIGSTTETAVQNAAENALTQVVGSFMSTDTLLKKRTEIQDGIRSKTKTIDTSVKEYSQGSISTFEILESSSENGINRVTAVVEVRIDDFRKYIEKLAEGEVTIKKGLFAKVATISTNSQNAKRIVIDDILFPIINGTAVEFEINEPTVWGEMKSTYKHPSPHFMGNHKLLDETIVIPVAVIVNKSFLENATKKLESISVDKKRFSWDIGRGVDRYSPNYPKLWDEKYKNDGFLFVLSSSQKTADLYTLKGVKGAGRSGSYPSSLDLKEELETMAFADTEGYMILGSQRFPDLLVTLLGHNNQIIDEAIVRKNSNDPYMFADRTWSNLMTEQWQYASNLRGGKILMIYPKLTFHLFMNLEPEVLAKIGSIKIAMFNN